MNMNAQLIAARIAKTKASIARSNHRLYELARGGAHVRYACSNCGQQFVIEQYHPPERPGYWDDNNWGVCPVNPEES